MLASGPGLAPHARRSSKRFALVAAGLCLAAGIVTWNVVFDRAIQSAEQRVLALNRQEPGSATIRGVMDPAIRGAAASATAWAAVVTGAGVVVALGAARRAGRSPQRRQSAKSG